MRHFGEQPPAASTAAVAAAHIRGSPGFVKEHQPPRIEAFHFGLPGRTSLLDVGPLLLRGMKDFF